MLQSPGVRWQPPQPRRWWLCSARGPTTLGLAKCLSFFRDLWGDTGCKQEVAFAGQCQAMERGSLRRGRPALPTAANTGSQRSSHWEPGLGSQDGGDMSLTPEPRGAGRTGPSPKGTAWAAPGGPCRKPAGIRLRAEDPRLGLGAELLQTPASCSLLCPNAPNSPTAAHLFFRALSPKK